MAYPPPRATQRRLRLQRRPQPRHIRPQRLGRPGRCPAPPEVFDQPPRRNYPAHIYQQQCQHRPLLRAAQRDRRGRPAPPAPGPEAATRTPSRRPQAGSPGTSTIVRPPHRAGKPHPPLSPCYRRVMQRLCAGAGVPGAGPALRSRGDAAGHATAGSGRRDGIALRRASGRRAWPSRGIHGRTWLVPFSWDAGRAWPHLRSGRVVRPGGRA